MSYGKYTFSHTFEKKFKTSMSTNSETAYEILVDFVHFLKGCQFGESSISDALQDISKEFRYVDK